MTSVAALYADRVRLVEYHEGGHALVAWHLGYRPRGVWANYCHDEGELDASIPDAQHMRLVALAGERAETLCPSWYPELGHPGSGHDRQLIADLGLRVTREVVAEVDGILLDRRRQLRRLARALEERHRLSGAELAGLLG